MLGPKQQLLASYVANADSGPLHDASTQWTQAETLLRRLSVQLESRAKEFGDPSKFSGSTAEAATAAFSQSSTKMSDRADQMRDGAEAFRKAAHAVHVAKQASGANDKHAAAQPPTQPPDLTDVEAQKDWKTKSNKFWDHYQGQETAAADAITVLTQNHREQAAVFAKIHGEPPPPQPPKQPTGSNPVTGGTPTPITHGPRAWGVIHDQTWVPTNDDTPAEDPTDDPANDPTDDPTDNDDFPGPVKTPTQVDPGVPQGPGMPGTTLPGVTGAAPIGGIGGGAGAAGGVGAVAGGALGGAAAAGLAGGLMGGLSGGVNGVMPLGGAGGVRGSLSASGVRGIGATSRAGAGSVLGRGSGAAGARGAGAGGTGSRNGRGSSRKGGAGSRGARGRAGARGAGAGAGAGRNGKDKKRQGEDRDLFDDGSDWIDDEDVAPGVLD